ncbi:ATP:cob(I)alamin adenosyltransferase [Candidatus Kaiserbacteria bacterium]|nr:MAG: ATP:cob(I)alamin adenosyltransferase [Candidatus Kaiserbacteria bacterium]
MYTHIMALYTGKGDGGKSGLFTGERLSKDEGIFEALGTVDELNTFVGWCKVACGIDWLINERRTSDILLDVQHHLFTIQAELAGAEKGIPEESIKDMEFLIETIEGKLPKIVSFLIPGGNELSSRLDITRTVSRRAERRLISDGSVSKNTLTYANRLSSLLYALVRFVNHNSNVEEKPPEYI